MASNTESFVPQKQPIFQDLNADDAPDVIEIESVCAQCRQNGITKLLLTKIPFYKEVVIMSFCCDNCHWENNELQPASKIQEKGVSYRLHVQNSKDLSRTVVKTKWASVMIPELDFEIPSCSQEGTVTTVEGIIERAYAGLSSKMDDLKEQDPESSSKLTEFLEKLMNFKSGSEPFTLVIRDCTGNSFLENILAPSPDPQLEETHFERSHEEDLMLCIYSLDCDDKENKTEEAKSEEPTKFTDEILGFPTNCYACNAPCVTNMKLTQIPYFKDVVIMATSCDFCGHKTNEIKGGAGIEPLGTRIILHIENEEDLKRDILKSDTCSISIKELELEVGSAAFSGRYTTVEGILTTIKEQLKESNPFISGDSAVKEKKDMMEILFAKIDEIIACKRKVTLILDDPCGNSYLQNLHYPDPETNLTVEKYERTIEQNEELGLIDMKVENYEES